MGRSNLISSKFVLSVSLSAAILSVLALEAGAQVWKCADGIYTSQPNSYQGCKPIAASKVCGKGNKYFSPRGEGLIEECEVTEEKVSPIVNYKLIEVLEAEKSSREDSKSKKSD